MWRQLGRWEGYPLLQADVPIMPVCVTSSSRSRQCVQSGESIHTPARRVKRIWAVWCGVNVWHGHGLPSFTRQHAKIIWRRVRLIGGETITAGSIDDIRDPR
jgi:hypothetical protein